MIERKSVFILCFDDCFALLQDNTPSLLDEHDFQFFYGDLNYRIDRAKADIIEALRDGHLEDLQEDDQLRKQMKVTHLSPTVFSPHAVPL